MGSHQFAITRYRPSSIEHARLAGWYWTARRPSLALGSLRVAASFLSGFTTSDTRCTTRCRRRPFQAPDFDAALEHARQALAVDPDFWPAYHQLAQGHEQRGETEAALTAVETASRLSGGNSKLVSLAATSRYVPPYAIALGYLGLQQADAMFQWLDRAYDGRDVHPYSRQSIRNGIHTAANGVSKTSSGAAASRSSAGSTQTDRPAARKA